MRRVLALILIALASSGCLVVALQPAYDDESVVFDESLIGHWENAEDHTSATIERAEWRSYKVSYTDRFTTVTFHANLTKAGSSTLLDLMETRGADAGPLLVPVHAIYRVEHEPDTLVVAPLDYAWFTRAMAQKTTGRLMVAFDGRQNAVVAASTRELRAWLTRPPSGAFGAPMTFTRKS